MDVTSIRLTEVEALLRRADGTVWTLEEKRSFKRNCPPQGASGEDLSQD